MPDTRLVRPSTIASIKRLANRLKRESGIAHHETLNLAARQGGFANYRHAQQQLGAVQPPGNTTSRQTFSLYISVHWRDTQGNRGRETLFMTLSAPWEELITRQGMGRVGKLRSLRQDGPNHLVTPPYWDSPESARQHAFRIGRVLQFIDATRLSPSSSHSRVYPGGRSSNAIPGNDHSSVWYHRPSGAYVFVDEPYASPLEGHQEERQQWADRHGYAIKMPSWPGIHNPDQYGGTRLCLVSAADNAALLDDLVSALDRLPRNWLTSSGQGESSQSLTKLVPPEAEPGVSREQGAKHTKPARKRRTAKTVAYRSLGGSSRRPAQRMSIAGHGEIGVLLQTIAREAYHRWGVVTAVNQVRNELVDWVQGEYTQEELPQDVFQELYYGGAPRDAPISRRPGMEIRQRWIADLERAKAVLADHYPDCAPVSFLIKKLDRAKGSVEKWNPK
ncbi:DUF5623 domain-containing protein [Modicisalibacter luteus]|uniref:DUF5623 domain-containing protein n=1 Tax=Modicisalibacter luteus TaxID=453962 RepID=A0ABV7LVX7_9GAMM|nr:DUF5623 domain-containing protein [Halomonas lutea]GHB14167.1 hypothetical protein GCM10007159_40670 [Halomonas lutea]